MITAGNLKEALDLAAPDRPDIVLLDFNLPDADGTSSVRAIRFRHTAAAIIGMSGESENGPIMLRLGVAGFLAKPFGIDELVRLTCCLMPTTSLEFHLPVRQVA